MKLAQIWIKQFSPSLIVILKKKSHKSKILFNVIHVCSWDFQLVASMYCKGFWQNWPSCTPEETTSVRHQWQCFVGSLITYIISNRFQQVTVLGKTSNLLPVISGVPQGSILGPLMFLIYVNDLARVSVSSSIALFADDNKCYRPALNIDDGRLLQEDLDRITLWCQDWRMDLNQSKCTVMSITRNISPVISSYMLQNAPVQRTDAQKDLGILVCKDLKWNCARSCF